jgi:hypothetical protein
VQKKQNPIAGSTGKSSLTISKAGWSWGCVSALDAHGHTIWTVDAHRGDGKRFVVRADEKLTALLEPESAIHRPDPRKAES